MFTIRNEMPRDYAATEALTRSAFYNVYIPGCVEHYLLHVMRSHPDFIPELDFVAECDGKIIGGIQYTKARLTDEDGNEKQILTFGPICVDPAYQRRGCGKQLMAHSFAAARRLDYDTVVIFGSPANYVSSGFVSCKKHNVCAQDGRFPAAMLVCELVSGALDGRRWFYHDSPVMAVSEEDAAAFDAQLSQMEKKRLPSQEEFYIMSQSFLD